MTDPAAAYFLRTDERRLEPTPATGGAWADDEQHVAPTIGLALHELERQRPSDLVLSRLAVEILMPPPISPFEVTVEVVRPGRTIELTDTTVTYHQPGGSRVGLRARAWRLASGDTREVAGGDPDPGRPTLPAPDDVPAWDMTSVWRGGFIGSLEVRRAAEVEPGRYTAWVRPGLPLVAGEDVGDLARWASVLDTANGLGVRRDPRTWMFPNVDLTLHLHRTPTGDGAAPWTGFDTQVTFGPGGLGLTASTVHDARGPVGRLAQSLTVRPLV